MEDTKKIELFEKIGYNCDEVKNKGRRLILPVGNNDFEVVLVLGLLFPRYVTNFGHDLFGRVVNIIPFQYASQLIDVH